MIRRVLIGEADLLIFGEVGGKLCFLSACPSEREPSGNDNVRLRQSLVFQFLRNRHKGEKIIVLVLDLIRKELLVSFTDEIVPAAIFEHIFRKQRLGIIANNAGFEAVVSGLDIAVTVIDSYD